MEKGKNIFVIWIELSGEPNIIIILKAAIAGSQDIDIVLYLVYLFVNLCTFEALCQFSINKLTLNEIKWIFLDMVKKLGVDEHYSSYEWNKLTSIWYTSDIFGNDNILCIFVNFTN